jgi:hypothetical protein
MLDEAELCVKCGCRAAVAAAKGAAEDARSAGYAVLGFFIPIVGLILYLIWKDTAPLRAKSAGKGALIGFIVSVALGIISGIVSAAIVGAAVNYF